MQLDVCTLYCWCTMHDNLFVQPAMYVTVTDLPCMCQHIHIGHEGMHSHQSALCMVEDAQVLIESKSVKRCISPCFSMRRIQGKALQGSQEQPHRAAVDQELVKDLVEGQVSLAAALRQECISPPFPAFQACLCPHWRCRCQSHLSSSAWSQACLSPMWQCIHCPPVQFAKCTGIQCLRGEGYYHHPPHPPPLQPPFQSKLAPFPSSPPPPSRPKAPFLCTQPPSQPFPPLSIPRPPFPCTRPPSQPPAPPHPPSWPCEALLRAYHRC